MDKKTMDKLINKLIQWLKAKGMSPDDILACIEYITTKS